MEGRNTRIYIVAWVIAILLAGGAAVYKYHLVSRFVETREVPKLGEPGSTHAHVSLLMMNKNEPISLCDKKFMLASQAVHFEDDDCTVVHKHATGVTLQEFFKSIEVKLTPTCFTAPDHPKLCSDGKNTLRVVLNGKEISITDLTYYELNNNDHIMINFGPEEGALLRFKYNAVPSIPLDVNEPDPDVLF